MANWLDDIKNQLTTAAPYLKGSLIGGTAGAALAGTASWQNKEDNDTPAARRRRILRDALMGGALGAGAGAALPAFGEIANIMAPPKTEDQVAADRFANVFAPGKAMGGITGTVAGGGAGYGIERIFRRGKELDGVYAHMRGVLDGARGKYDEITKAVQGEMTSLKGTAMTDPGLVKNWDNAFDKIIHENMVNRGLRKGVGKWDTEWQNEVKKWTNKARIGQHHLYEPTLQTFVSDFGRTPTLAGKGQWFGGFGPQGLVGEGFSKLLNLMRPKHWSGPEEFQLGRLLQPTGIRGNGPGLLTTAQASAELDRLMKDPSKFDQMQRSLAKTYSGRGVKTGPTWRSWAAMAGGAAAPTILPYALPAVAGLKGLLHSTVVDDQ